ncbi:MAG: aspartate-semialdehyde dehydrogenase [Alphaproteobacteria bacterium RIFCSPLOWO2_01_FULL_40_26]|nr:MAG: aspartate-semialdehyde dehydrogenase [Alphaproteobacteria bacterium RIFCSPHIGHO2_02_FULL_40_34]OFW95314.1 MAG: aspartate-semialdehyde dehydrogenase [Alphaproteobacteria bacterium RIFCSPLOWO2_01_FULL_40_26]OFX09217.1 MAG: aspartate-semialdehyde dehydrogenase [Alphaproteobacteria bacterium RIFCSPLOWO2_02_FULL_40_19]OFX11572.1 MAG: aspartate-semialdehyde dehydrogenase [Alphaproteobacteria bacterium RIFCSPLOWO2_12_FULL_40_11]
MSRKIAVAGATGNVGREILNILAERKFPADEVVALASRNSIGKKVSYGDKILTVQALEDFDFTGTKIGLFSPGGKVSAIHAPRAAASGCVVIDNTSHFRMEKDIPLVVPEVNPQAIADYKKRGIIANPNCSTIQMVVALKPLHDLAKIKRVVVATYQATSGAGKEAMDELYDSTKKIYQNEFLTPKKFSRRIAFNVIPQIDVFMDDGCTKEEWKMKVETKKILDEKIEIEATCVRVPVFNAHSEALNVEFEKAISVEQAREALENSDGIIVIDRPEEMKFITPIEASAHDPVYVSRIRKDPSIKHGLSMWVVSDNLKKGAALNTVQIAELLVRDYGF